MGYNIGYGELTPEHLRTRNTAGPLFLKALQRRLLADFEQFSQAPLACLLRVSDIDKILYSVDYPFVPNENGLNFIKELQESDLVTAEQLEMICHRNAEKLLKIKLDR